MSPVTLDDDKALTFKEYRALVKSGKIRRLWLAYSGCVHGGTEIFYDRHVPLRAKLLPRKGRRPEVTIMTGAFWALDMHGFHGPSRTADGARQMAHSSRRWMVQGETNAWRAAMPGVVYE